MVTKMPNGGRLICCNPQPRKTARSVWDWAAFSSRRSLHTILAVWASSAERQYCFLGNFLGFQLMPSTQMGLGSEYLVLIQFLPIKIKILLRIHLRHTCHKFLIFVTGMLCQYAFFMKTRAGCRYRMRNPIIDCALWWSCASNTI